MFFFHPQPPLVQSLHLHLPSATDPISPFAPQPPPPPQVWQAEWSQFRAVTSSYPTSLPPLNPSCLKNINTSFLLHQSDEGSSWGEITLVLRTILFVCVCLSISLSNCVCFCSVGRDLCTCVFVCLSVYVCACVCAVVCEYICLKSFMIWN